LNKIVLSLFLASAAFLTAALPLRAVGDEEKAARVRTMRQAAQELRATNPFLADKLERMADEKNPKSGEDD
jgi:hypothetical protein